ncbi:hypothetical protein P9D43_20920 [Neobacillus niacini]|uniref:hypothetical protein n=1 Tax=Neobacillus niacini TaxID=86668 RepID=UPI0007AB7D27|nr:hypothetical protein [Neobacillus niacini]MEC1524469.1 hypothetical protein [Neobacillus niacini]
MKIFMLRSKPNNTERIDVFLRDNVVTIGWQETGDLTNATKEDIREALKSNGYEGQSLLTNLGLVNAFVRTMQEGDLVLIRQGNIVHIGEVGPYRWAKEYEDMKMSHAHSVKRWFTPVAFNQLNASMQSLLKNIRTIAQYHGTIEEADLLKFISDNPEEKPNTHIPAKDKENLLANTLEILKDLANNATDEKVRLEAARELLNHLKSTY